MKTDKEDVLETNVEAPASTGPTWEERVAKQRSQWRAQDQSKYINPSYDPELDATWNIYMWRGETVGWEKVGQHRKKPGRRKGMTMNRLFANIRQKFEVAGQVPLLLISEQDDAERIKNKQFLAPPGRRPSLRPEEPPARSLATPGKREVAPEPRNAHLLKADGTPKKAPTKPEPKKEAKVLPLKKAEQKSTPEKSVGERVRFASWGSLNGKSYFLGTWKGTSKRDAHNAAHAKFTSHTGIRTVAIADMPYSTRNEIVAEGVVPGVTEMEAP